MLQLRRRAVDCIDINLTSFRDVGRDCGATLLQSLAGGECCFWIVDPSFPRRESRLRSQLKARIGQRRTGNHSEANDLRTTTRNGLVSTLSNLTAKAQQTTINMGLINRGPTRTAARAPN